jgi:hypothetical protein
MTTIEIVQEQPAAKPPVYRAIHGQQQATGATPGQALDSLERALAVQQSGLTEGTTIIIQRFQPDTFFTASQQHRLQELMDRFHAASAAGQELALDEKQELEQLVDAEWQTAIERSSMILNARPEAKTEPE